MVLNTRVCRRRWQYRVGFWPSWFTYRARPTFPVPAVGGAPEAVSAARHAPSAPAGTRLGAGAVARCAGRTARPAEKRTLAGQGRGPWLQEFSDRKSTRLNSSHQIISYAVFCLKKKKKK